MNQPSSSCFPGRPCGTRSRGRPPRCGRPPQYYLDDYVRLERGGRRTRALDARRHAAAVLVVDLDDAVRRRPAARPDPPLSTVLWTQAQISVEPKTSISFTPKRSSNGPSTATGAGAAGRRGRGCRRRRAASGCLKSIITSAPMKLERRDPSARTMSQKPEAVNWSWRTARASSRTTRDDGRVARVDVEEGKRIEKGLARGVAHQVPHAVDGAADVRVVGSGGALRALGGARTLKRITDGSRGRPRARAGVGRLEQLVEGERPVADDDDVLELGQPGARIVSRRSTQRSSITIASRPSGRACTRAGRRGPGAERHLDHARLSSRTRWRYSGRFDMHRPGVARLQAEAREGVRAVVCGVVDLAGNVTEPLSNVTKGRSGTTAARASSRPPSVRTSPHHRRAPPARAAPPAVPRAPRAAAGGAGRSLPQDGARSSGAGQVGLFSPRCRAGSRSRRRRPDRRSLVARGEAEAPSARPEHGGVRHDRVDASVARP